MIVGALMAAPSLTDGRLATEGCRTCSAQSSSSPWGTLLLIDVAIAVFVCTLAIQTAASRLMFSMARDGRLPASKTLSKVNARTGTPIAPSVLIGIACILVLAVNVGNSAIFTTLSSVCIVLIYLAYLMVTVPLLRRRLQGWPHGDVQYDSEGRKLFSLGVFGVPVNIAAVLYGAAMVINLSWPRAEIFNPAGDMPILDGCPDHRRCRRPGGRSLLPARQNRSEPRHDWSYEVTTTDTATDTTTAAREHARSQAGAITDSMPVLPASGWPTPPAGIDADRLTWAESVPGGRYTSKVLVRGTRLRLRDIAGSACANLLLYRADAPHERLNIADTVKVPWQAYLRVGHPLLSDQGRVLATVVADTSGHHDAFCERLHWLRTQPSTAKDPSIRVRPRAGNR